MTDILALLGVSGGTFDDFDGEIVDAIFVESDFTDDDGNPLVELELTLDVPDVDKPVTRNYMPQRATFEITDGGRRIVSVDDPDTVVNVNGGTRMGRLLTAVGTIAGDNADLLAEITSRIDSGLNQQDAALLVGLNFHWLNVTYKTRNPVTKEDGEATLLVPSAFNGAAKKAAPKKTAAKKPAPVDETTETEAPAPRKSRAKKADATLTNGLTAAQVTAATKLFNALDDSLSDDEAFETWLAEALDALGDLTDEGLDHLSATDDGLWDSLVA